MASLNKVQLIGRLGQDPELKQTDGGTSVCNMSIATDRSWKDRDGNYQKETDWHRIVVWGKQGENCSEYLSKGRQVYIEGRMQTRQWETDGIKRYVTEVVAQFVLFLGDKSDRQSGAGNPRNDDGPPPVDDDDVPF